MEQDEIGDDRMPIRLWMENSFYGIRKPPGGASKQCNILVSKATNCQNHSWSSPSSVFDLLKVAILQVGLPRGILGQSFFDPVCDLAFERAVWNDIVKSEIGLFRLVLKGNDTSVVCLIEQEVVVVIIRLCDARFTVQSAPAVELWVIVDENDLRVSSFNSSLDLRINEVVQFFSPSSVRWLFEFVFGILPYRPGHRITLLIVQIEEPGISNDIYSTSSPCDLLQGSR